jgi:flavin-dependent dehydrogenase
MPDATIIGGGPAGATCAILLARGGWDVTVIEQSRFPRDKVCGECLSTLGYDVLRRLGLAASLHDSRAIRLDFTDVHPLAGKSIRLTLSHPMWGISRNTLDALLLSAAREAGATIHQPARCESIRPELRIRDLNSNVVRSSRPSHVILADGKAAFADVLPEPTGDFGIKTHFQNIEGPLDTIELFGVHGSYGGLAAIEGGRWNAAFSVPGDRIKGHRGDLDALFEEVKSENVVLARRAASARRVSGWHAAPLPRFAVRKSWPANVIPLGNAAAAIEPIGGEGMGLAMHSAEMAAKTLLGGLDPRRLQADFEKLWNIRRVAYRAAGIAASRLKSIRIPRVAVDAALRLVGK